MRDSSRWVQICLLADLLSQLTLAWLRKWLKPVVDGGDILPLRRHMRNGGRIAVLVVAVWGATLAGVTAGGRSGVRSALWTSRSLGPDRLDPITAGCAQCHDGTQASAVPLTAGFRVRPASFGTLRRGLGHSGNHPVGIDYEAYALRAPRRLRPRFALAKSIHLPEGRLSCISCHRLKPEEEANLDRGRTYWLTRQTCVASKQFTRSLRRSELCLSCHIK